MSPVLSPPPEPVQTPEPSEATLTRIPPEVIEAYQRQLNVQTIFETSAELSQLMTLVQDCEGNMSAVQGIAPDLVMSLLPKVQSLRPAVDFFLDRQFSGVGKMLLVTAMPRAEKLMQAVQEQKFMLPHELTDLRVGVDALSVACRYIESNLD